MRAARAILFLALAMLFTGAASAAESTLDYGPFGRLNIYAPAGKVDHVVLFVSGDGGWNRGVVDMAHALTGLHALVVGIDITHYLAVLEKSQRRCAYFAGDLEGLSQYVQKTLGLRDYRHPLLVGYSSGATLVYAALAEAPAGTFAGAISLGFSLDLMLRKPICGGAGLRVHADPKLGQIMDPDTDLSAPWVVLHGDIDQVCDAATTQAFMAKVKAGELIRLPKVGHGFAVQRHWMPQFKDAFTRIVRQSAPPPPPPDVGGLPLIEVPSATAGDTLAVLLTGDGGWAGLDREVAAGLAAHGIPVVGWDSLRYFWSARTPDEVGADLTKVLRHYLAKWGRQRVLLVGYSFGADALPVMANRLPADLRARVERIVLLSPGRAAELEFHVGSWLGRSGDDTLPLRPEVDQLGALPVLCLYGADESTDSLCPELRGEHRRAEKLPGGHHFDGNYARLVQRIIQPAERPAAPAR